MKSEILEQLGQTDILLPSRINEGLAANDRIKARLSVLQAAARHARNPNGIRFDLTDECRAVGIDPVPLEMLVNRASLLAGERIAAPGLGNLKTAIWADVTAMAEAVAKGDTAAGDAARARLIAIKAAGGSEAPDEVELAQIGKLTGLSATGDDSLHRVVMDLHKTLNHLSAAHAEEIVAGAHVHGLAAQDRVAVEAFMRGVEATRMLKFDHPGLATTAARSGTRLTIQNDIGETDAHVVVVVVEPDATTITYTDVHLARAKFFTGLFGDFAVQWSGLERKNAAGLGDDGAFYLVTGRYAVDDKHCAAFLEAIGASLVFLIDWNKARKVLRTLVPKNDAVHVLDWAARHRFGHRGFLELGGSELIASAVRHAAPTRIGFGERLDQSLGREAAIDFLKTVLRVSAEALLAGGSIRLARDRIEADLNRHLQRVDSTLLKIVVRQAGLAREIAAGIAQFVAEQHAHRPFDRAALALQARRIEEKADRIAVEARSEIARLDADRSIERLVNRIEEAIDELEQAAFVASLVPSQIAEDLIQPLSELCDAAVTGAEAAAIAAAAAADVREGHRVDSEDALAAVGRLIEAEHGGDAAERAIMTILLRGDFDLKCALSVLELTRALERATDRLAGFGHLLREYVIADSAA
jgi:hypothetical protein